MGTHKSGTYFNKVLWIPHTQLFYCVRNGQNLLSAFNLICSDSETDLHASFRTFGQQKDSEIRYGYDLYRTIHYYILQCKPVCLIRTQNQFLKLEEAKTYRARHARTHSQTLHKFT